MSTALYRRYRPESFADVIGQEHVTEPLMAALSKNRVNHAYLFSGPRGCGKTTSARILARCLNCAEGPTPVPCGKCDSCVELARDGSGSLDVLEIDAASHGGVDDARDLRERATFAPVRDRYKIFIIDEAHMVTPAGFNALLKIVEEPPEHIKFIFATTEPDKVIGTIRSRTHHYPFRLVPPEPLLAYLDRLCQQENVPVAPGVLSLVIRAGGGSVRDSLSVLDQLMAGAGPDGLDYELAVNLLGYTPISLLDDVVDAFAAGDSATVFRAVDRVIQTGQDPRRFVEDLLERFRDLIIVHAMPDSAAAVLRGMPEDQINRMSTQAAQLGGAELSRAADITNTALTEMTGATSPRLHLELLCARILLPASDQTERGTAARVDRLERRLSYAGDSTEAVGRAAAASSPVESIPAGRPTMTPETPAVVADAPSAPAASSPAPAAAEPVPAVPAGAPAGTAQDSSPLDWGGTWATAPEPQASARPAAAAPASAPASTPASAPEQSRRPAASGPERPQVSQPASAAQPSAQANQPAANGPVPAGSGAAPGAAPSGGQIEMIRRAWPEIMDALTGIRRATWLNVSKNASPKSFDGRILELAFSNQGAATNFNRPDHLENLRKAVSQVLGVDCQVNVVHDSSAAAGESGPKAGSRLTPAPASAQVQAPPQQQSVQPQSAEQHSAQPQSAQANSAQKTAAVAPVAAASRPAPAAPAPAAQPSPSASAPAPTPTAQAAPAASASPAPAASPARDVQGAAPVASGPAAAAALNRRRGQSNMPDSASQAPRNGRQSAPQPGRARKAAPGGPLPEDWQQEPPEDPYAGGPESNAWEQAEPPADVYSAGHLSDTEWAATNWAGTGSSPARQGAREAQGTSARGDAVAPGTAAAAPSGPKAAAGPGLPGVSSAPTEADRPAAAQGGPPQASAAPAAAQPQSRPQQPSQPAPSAPAPNGTGRPLSRYQKLLNEAAQRGVPANGSAGRGNVNLVEDVPSADDIRLEDSGLVGRKAIERILGGRLIEERSLDGR
ncbi:DNA polymerase III subunit gamma and tau [Arthrobacter sp. zg-Y820]|uniref:DNA polymerase III subunit gamma and tau n=1 Tax=unclassified Arthrobacter TaxID=235627 RepID=UPI0025414A0B|nr:MULTISPECIES: DNA polymerase III subunit gamma and tau [unclassified Arthrobacter]MCC9197566.1 DNA polymerase III subunit gamma and tau [Arthrobacter sp. zg-Y820]MDK1280433.1 DNA polymerase III subunit gamma and tau [Arthrobacter sp. zg.Y820]WIB09709.1 DNA polymerase III subunit gamma and tau [Arthrobacter sp. zg-Y820]